MLEKRIPSVGSKAALRKLRWKRFERMYVRKMLMLLVVCISAQQKHIRVFYAALYRIDWAQWLEIEAHRNF